MSKARYDFHISLFWPFWTYSDLLVDIILKRIKIRLGSQFYYYWFVTLLQKAGPLYDNTLCVKKKKNEKLHIRLNDFAEK